MWENQIISHYNDYDEDGRMFCDHVHQAEWHYLNKYVSAGSHIFDGCAGTGNYAFALAGQGHSVVVSDIFPHNEEIAWGKQAKEPLLKNILVGDICDLSA